MPEYCVYTNNPQFVAVLEWLDHRQVVYDVHLNRTRFVIEDPVILTEFLLTWGDICKQVHKLEDTATGLRWTLDRDLGGVV